MDDEAVTVSWVTTEVREYKATFTQAALRAAGLTVRNGQLTQTEPPSSHWETPDRFLASHEGPGTQEAGYIESRTAEAMPAGTAAAPGPAGDEPAAPAWVVELDGKTVPLADCDWVEWAPCGCPVGTAAGRNGLAIEEDAWKDFYPREADRERAQKQGYRWELMTHDRWSAEVADLMIAGCPHAPAAETGAGRVTSRDEPAVPALTGGPDYPDNAPDPQEMADAYQAVHHKDAPWLTRQQWQAGQLSTATGTVLTAPWYLAAIAAKKDGRPMSAVPRYMAAAEMDAAAGRLRDHRDPSGSGDDARDVADALSDAAAAMRAGDLAEARSAITWARSAITPGSSLHRILNEHERPVINFASLPPLPGPLRRAATAAAPPLAALDSPAEFGPGRPGRLAASPPAAGTAKAGPRQLRGTSASAARRTGPRSPR